MRSRAALTFRNKLKLAFLAVTIMAVLVTGGLSYYIAADILEEKSLTLTQDSVVKSAQIIDEKLNKLMLVMMTFLISEPFNEIIASVSAGDSSDYFRHLNDMDNVFSQARVAEPLIQSIYVSTPIGDFHPLSINRNHHVAFQDTSLYERIVQEKRNIWVEGHDDQLFRGNDRVVSLVFEPVVDTTLYAVKDVYVVVNIRENGLRRLVESDELRGTVRFLVNADGEPVLSGGSPLIAQWTGNGMISEIVRRGDAGQVTQELNHEEYLINYASLGISGWKIVSIQSKSNALQDLNYVKWMILIIILGCFVVITIVSSVLIRFLLKPLMGLQSVMKRIEQNDLNARFEVRSGDEIGQIGVRFNRMLDEIVSLIEDVEQAEMNKRATEIKALSAQMDPHFLYNTLNTIYWKLKLQKTEESRQMVMSLSRLFQLGLNKGQEFLPLESELEHVRQHLDLQKYCYEQLFDYSIDLLDPTLRQLRVPRIMLQPLVENSILHGFRDREDGGFIRIVIDSDQVAGICRITVSDNGVGVDEQTTAALLERTSERGYALGNLVSRLSLYYGDAEQWVTIDSTPGSGMVVSLSIPLKEGNSDG